MTGTRSIHQRVVDAIVTVTGFEESDVTPDADLRSDLGVVDLDLVEIVIELEQEFDFAIDEDAADDWTHVRDVVAYLEKEFGR
jgi:acyl carrier protein